MSEPDHTPPPPDFPDAAYAVPSSGDAGALESTAELPSPEALTTEPPEHSGKSDPAVQPDSSVESDRAAETDTAHTADTHTADPADHEDPGLTGWLGGDPDDVALLIGGTEISYATLTAQIEEAVLELSEDELAGTDPLLAHDGDLLTALVTCYAGIASGRPVLFCDPEQPVPRIGRLPDEAQLLVTTSGSTGKPRVVARTWRSWRASLAPFTELTEITADDVVGLTGPLHTSMHLFAALHTLWRGATLTDTAAGATVVHCVPSTLDSMVRAGTAVRLAVIAGAAMTTGLADRARTLGVEIVEYYGAAELSFVAARRYRRPMGAFPGVEVSIRDGEVWARSPYLALGYAGEAGALRFDEDGFASVGDFGSFAGESLVIRGRSDAAVTTGGTTVLAEDIEAVLTAAPGVRAAAVVGIPHERLGEVVVAVLECEDGARGADIRIFARSRLQPAALPRRWFIAELPRTTNGKVHRGIVRSRLIDGSLDQQPLP